MLMCEFSVICLVFIYHDIYLVFLKFWLVRYWDTSFQSFPSCLNRHLFKSGRINISLIHVSYPHVILFLSIIVFLWFYMYFLSEVSPMRALPFSYLAPEDPPWETLKIDHCEICVLKFEASYYFSLTYVHWIWSKLILIYFYIFLH